MRPLSATNQGPDHERVRELYANLLALTADTDEPLEQARLAVLHEILEPDLQALQHTAVSDPSAVIYNVKAAMGALVMLLCHVDEPDYDAAADSLQTALELLHEAQGVLGIFRGDVAEA
jgi:hypothetical protein